MIFVVESIYILCIFCKLRYYKYLHTTTLILVKGALDAHGSNQNFFFHEFDLSMHLIYWFSIEFSQYRKVNEFEFFYESGLSVHLMYTNFLWTFTISYISWI